MRLSILHVCRKQSKSAKERLIKRACTVCAKIKWVAGVVEHFVEINAGKKTRRIVNNTPSLPLSEFYIQFNLTTSNG